MGIIHPSDYYGENQPTVHIGEDPGSWPNGEDHNPPYTTLKTGEEGDPPSDPRAEEPVVTTSRSGEEDGGPTSEPGIGVFGGF